MLTILLKFKEKLLKTIEIDKDVITIGRIANNDIQIDNLSVSKNHAKITRTDAGYAIKDLDSTNGTFVNEKAVSAAALNHEDVVTVGKHNLLILFEKIHALEPAATQQSTKDTMLLTTEKHLEMLKKQKKDKS
jgi:pSer/pThr/pTyr-binding forkhead associated (FHA) protein